MISTIDTRFLLRHFTADTDALRAKTREKMHELQREPAVLPSVVLHELYAYQCRKLGRDTAETRANLVIKAGFRIVALDIAIAKKSAELRCRHPNLPTADAVIAATAIIGRAPTVVTDDPHFHALEEIRTEWF